VKREEAFVGTESSYSRSYSSFSSESYQIWTFKSKPQSEKGLTDQNRFLTVSNPGLICGLVTGLN
jgi:hypothetical protein